MFNLCRYVNEEGIVYQEELNTMFGSSFNKAIDCGYIATDNDLYYITDSGLAYLANHKVDNAVIIASGFRSRFIPFTYDMPHGLLEVRGESLVERQINQLKKVGIDDISIVVGYLGEQFEYLIDKYDVKIIETENHDEYDILSGLKLVKDELKNTYVVTADLYLGDHILHGNEKDSWYGAMFNEFLARSNSPDLDEDDKIIGISRRKPSNQWILKGPIFLNEETSKLIQNNLKNSTTNFNNFFSDILKESSMEILEVKEHDVFVLNTLEALRAFDRSYLIPGKHPTLDLIAHVFRVKQDEIFDIIMMKVGMTNDSFLFTVDNHHYVFRVPGKGTNVLLQRDEEALVYDAIEDLNISDEIVYFNPVTGYKITRYYEDIRSLNVHDMDEVAKSIDILLMLHNKNVEVSHSFCLKERTNFYKGLCDETNAAFYDGFDEVYSKINLLFEYIEALNRPSCLCHIDANGDNFLVLDDGSLRLIDWEYAGMSDPLVDIAMITIFAQYDDTRADQILSIYKQGKETEEERFIYYTYIAISSFMWTLWTNYKEALGEDYSDYGLKKFKYAKKYINKSLELKAILDEQ